MESDSILFFEANLSQNLRDLILYHFSVSKSFLIRYTIKVQRELELDERAIHALREDRRRFLCKAVENYINCLLSGEEHDMWIFRLCSLWLENSGVSAVNDMIKVSLRAAFQFLHFYVERKYLLL